MGEKIPFPPKFSCFSLIAICHLPFSLRKILWRMVHIMIFICGLHGSSVQLMGHRPFLALTLVYRKAICSFFTVYLKRAAAVDAHSIHLSTPLYVHGNTHSATTDLHTWRIAMFITLWSDEGKWHLAHSSRLKLHLRASAFLSALKGAEFLCLWQSVCGEHSGCKQRYW